MVISVTFMLRHYQSAGELSYDIHIMCVSHPEISEKHGTHTDSLLFKHALTYLEVKSQTADFYLFFRLFIHLFIHSVSQSFETTEIQMRYLSMLYM